MEDWELTANVIIGVKFIEHLLMLLNDDEFDGVLEAKEFVNRMKENLDFMGR